MTDEPRFEHDAPGGFTDPFSDPEAVEGRLFEEDAPGQRDEFAEGIEESWRDDDPYALDDDPYALEVDEETAATQAEAREYDRQAAERGELGFSLSWWRDTSLLEAHRAMGDLFDNTLHAVTITKALRLAGLPEEVQTVQLDLNRLSGPLVMAGLQLLGFYFPELREEIKTVLSSIPRPTPTEEERAQIEAAIDELNRREAAELEQSLRGMGLHVICEDDLERLAEENDDADGTLGLGLN